MAFPLNFLSIFRHFWFEKCHISQQQLQFEYKNVFITISFSFRPKKFVVLQSASDWLFAFLEKVHTCFTKLNLSSISMPRMVTIF